MKNIFRKNILSYELILLGIIIITFIIFAASAPGFFSVRNFFVLLRTMSIIAIMGIGVAFVITTGEIDLSIGNLPALCAVTLAVLLRSGTPLPVALLAAFGVALLFGCLNWFLVAEIGLPSIISSLATGMIAMGIAYVLSGNSTVIVSNTTFLNTFGKNIGSFPRVFIWMVALGVVSYIIMNKSKFGRELAFIGDNKVAALFAGINTKSGIGKAFIICAIFSFFAGMCGAAQSSNATANMLTTSMMTAFSATFIGGTVMSGGKGNIIGTLLGAFFLALLTNGLLILGLDQWILYLINGIIIISSILLGNRLQGASKN
jgi:ribose/xylose/arabinose/galactoside ABC-type transport system permease subunit